MSRYRGGSDWSFVVGIIFAVCVMVFGIFYYAHASASCHDKGGTLVRGASGLYKCIDGKVIK